MPSSSQFRWAFLALLGGATGIALAPIWVRWSEVGPSATAFHRLFLAQPVLWAWLGWENRRAPPLPCPARTHDFALLASAGFLFAADLALWHWSIKLTSVANATLFANFAPIFVTLGAWWWLEERITAGFLAGLVLALGGGVLVAGVSLSHTLRQAAGDALGLLTAVFYGSYLLVIKRLRSRLSTATIMAWSGLATCPWLLLATGVSGEGLLPPSTHGWNCLVALALTAQVAGQGLIAFASAHLPASFLSVSLLFQPAMAALFAWIILAEGMTRWQSLGAMVVLGGIGLAGWKRG